jgi:DNA-binding NtrC family response regulator
MSAFNNLIGQSAEIQAVIRSAQIVAATDVTVLIEGDTGTGKELMAKAIHTCSNRADKKFITLNCAALPEALAESELFGHKKGAFTGAINDQLGYAKQAEGGTLFLDEISELSLAIQAKLLRFIEYGECQRVGDSNPQRIDVRLVAASNCDLQKRVKAGLFREDLYYRLKVVPLELPTLQQRGKDITVLAKHFINDFSNQHNLAKPKLTTAALKQMLTYSWPGNVRELRNMCERLVVLLPGKEITEKNLPLEAQKTENKGFVLPLEGIDLEYIENDLMRQALDASRGNKSRAARMLGISRDAFLYRLKSRAI